MTELLVVRRHVLRTIGLGAATLALAVTPLSPVSALPTGQTGLDIVAWGRDVGGAPDSETGTDVPPLPEGAEVVDVSGGAGYALALLSDGSVVHWGRSLVNQPESIEGVTAIQAGMDDAIALTEDGDVIAWGINTAVGVLAVPDQVQAATVKSISLTDRHALALTSEGSVLAWGFDDYGDTDVPATLDDQHVVAVAAGFDHSLALTDDGQIVSWGGWKPEEPPALPNGVTYTAISAASHYSLALRSDGEVVGWGSADDYRPEIAPPFHGQDVVAISLGQVHALALTRDGHVITWGDDTYEPLDVPTSLEGRTITAISASMTEFFLVATLGKFADPSATVTGTRQVGETLTASATATPTPASVQWQWLRDGDEIDGATGSTYDLVTADAATHIQARATLSAPKYDDVTVTSPEGDTIATRPMPGTTSVAVDGRALTGSTLSATLVASGLPADHTVTWRWRRDGVPLASYGARHRLTTADRGHRMTAVATITGAGYTPRTSASRASAVVRLPARVLRVNANPARVHRQHPLVVTATGLLPHERYRVRIGTRSLATGLASATGKVSRRLTVPRTTALGVRRVSVVGGQADRAGSDTVRVLRR